jgi:hypothetical protein
LLEAWWEQSTEQVHPPALLSGHDLLNHFDLKPGPLIGEILESLREAQVEKKVSTREQALEFCKEYLS